MFNFPPQLRAMLPTRDVGANPLQVELGKLANLHVRVFQIASDANSTSYNNREGFIRAGRECIAILDTANATKQSIQALLGADPRAPVLMNQVDYVISAIKKYINLMRSSLLRIDGYSGAIVLAVSASDYKILEPVPAPMNIPFTGNLWAFLRDTTVRNYIQQLSVNKRTESNTLDKYFNNSLIQEQSRFWTMYNGPGNVDYDFSLGRYGVVVNTINLNDFEKDVPDYSVINVDEIAEKIINKRNEELKEIDNNGIVSKMLKKNVTIIKQLDV
jgi:hypothetical protein